MELEQGPTQMHLFHKGTLTVKPRYW